MLLGSQLPVVIISCVGDHDLELIDIDKNLAYVIRSDNRTHGINIQLEVVNIEILNINRINHNPFPRITNKSSLYAS